MPEILPGSLSVVRPAASREGAFETFIKVAADGTVTAFNGHVDLGTGIRTALGQIVAEELDVSLARVIVVLGDTSRAPNQGATIASENHPDHRGAAAQGGGARRGTFCSRARRRSSSLRSANLASRTA